MSLKAINRNLARSESVKTFGQWVGMAILLAGLPACSNQLTYNTLQAWQQQTCYAMNDPQERSRCLASTSKSYEDYKSESEAVKGGR
jgi:hypothetical protein